MHRAFDIEEILLNILDHFSLSNYCFIGSDWIKTSSDLVALARTCHAFKEPALDLLWEKLLDSSPLARCLPEASYPLSQTNLATVYSFSRPLTQTEWATLQSYTRRTRFAYNFNIGLDWDSIATFLDPPTTEPLFPNLHTLYCSCAEKAMPLLRFPFPSLNSLFIHFERPDAFYDGLEPFANFSADITRLSVGVSHRVVFHRIEPNMISRWQNLCFVHCSGVMLDDKDLAHLSRMPALIQLAFALPATWPASNSLLVFSKLNDLRLHARSLEPISELLSQIRLPALTDLRVDLRGSRFSRVLTSFLAGVSLSNTDNTLERLYVGQLGHNASGISGRASLDFKDLEPCMKFSRLRGMRLDVQCNVDLADSDVLVLASAWPKLERLVINPKWSWNSRGGITPGTLIQLLQMCPSLGEIALRFNTRGYTEVPPSHILANLKLVLPPSFSLHVVDSAIKAESVPAVTTFLCGIATCFVSISCFTFFSAWNYWQLEHSNASKYEKRWSRVERRIYEVLGQHIDWYEESENEEDGESDN